MNDIDKWKLRAHQIAEQQGKPMRVVRHPRGEFQISADTGKHPVPDYLNYVQVYSTREQDAKI
jgi:hypothetical protein